MKLPHADRAFIPRDKLVAYMLSEVHPVGKDKARVLRKYGFNEENVGLLEQLLLEIARTQPVTEWTESMHGVKYVVEGLLLTPSAKAIPVRTVWIVEYGRQTPRFVTAYPL